MRAQKTIHDGQIASLRQLDGRLYAAFDFNTNCRLEKSTKVFEVGAGFKLKTIFQADNANSIDVTGIEVTKDRFVLVGIIRNSCQRR